jgi:ubiquinone/menaquinone biosynthesis C-methylase UbiE
MNKNDKYDESYYYNNHIKWLNSFFGFFVKLYYRYIASYIMAKAAKIKKGNKILDIGCGVGILVQQFNKLGYQATGVDVNKEAIQNSISPKNCFLVQTTAELNYPKQYFDLIVSREVLEHIPVEDIDACIKEWDRVSKGQMIHIIAVKERGPSAIDDPTHINVQNEKWWIDKFGEYGYIAIKKPKKIFFSPFGSEGYFMFIKNKS